MEDRREEQNFSTLSDEELVILSRKGVQDAEEYLIRKYSPVAKNKAKLYFIVGADREDVVQEGMIGIFKAIRDYKPEGGASLKSFVSLCVNRQIITAVRKGNREGQRLLSDSVSLHEEYLDSEVPLMEFVADRDLADPETLTLVKELTDSLADPNSDQFSALEREIWRELRRGFTYREIAEVLDKSPKSVDNGMQRIRRKWHAYLRG